MAIIKVDPGEARVSGETLDLYVKMMNGISFCCSEYGEYDEGYRNKIAVDLTVGSYMLGLDAKEVMGIFIGEGIIDPDNDDESPTSRVITILDYSHRFEWNWMINPDGYIPYGADTDTDTEDYKVLFVID